MRVSSGSYQLDDDPARIDVSAAAAFLTTSAYWGRWRSVDDIKEQIAGAWRVVGAYDESGEMVGFARAFGDGASAYLADVYVLPGHRGAGLGKAIVRLMVDQGPGAGWRWMLHTADAHGLYRQSGFAAPDARYLERPRERPAAADPLDTGVLTGERVRLEPLGHRHADGLAAAAGDGGDLYRWTFVPRDSEHAHRYIETALAARDQRTQVAYAVIRLADDTVIGSTRFHQLDYWAWPEREPGPAVPGLLVPDAVEIGYTWLGPGSIRTGANAEMKRLMLTHAFETWRVKSVCLHTDARNDRSRAAMERIGARFDGILPAHRLAADLTPRDSARYSVTADRWPEVRAHLAELDAQYLRR
jgi:N-acetyltransferase